MNKKVILVFSTAFILIPLFFVRGALIDDLQKKIQDRELEIKALEAEIAKYQGALDKQTGVSKSLNGEIKRLEGEIKKLNADITLTQYNINKTDLNIQKLSLEIIDKEKSIERDSNSLRELLRSINDNDELSVVEVLLSRLKISDFLGDIQSYESVGSDVRDQLILLQNDKKELLDERNTRENEEAKLKLLKQDLTGRKIAGVALGNSKKTLLKDSKNQETVYAKILRQREEKLALIQKEIQGIEDQLRLLIDPNSIPKKSSGVLSAPVANPFITQQFGFTDFALTYGSDVYRGNGHNGIDFRAAIGTRVLVAADGVVKNIGDTDTVCPGGSYGKYIIIEHSNNLSTLYAHLSSISVVSGQKVARGEGIGYSGNTGYVTGPHVHLTVYASNTYRLAKTIHCGLVPAGGYINPMDYL